MEERDLFFDNAPEINRNRIIDLPITNSDIISATADLARGSYMKLNWVQVQMEVLPDILMVNIEYEKGQCHNHTKC